jgi:catechol 2,3-dioxygenase-like lactoylglutathione lyase family enzyme
MAVTGPDFISLQVRDLERSAAFYEQYLGLKRSDAGPPHAVVFDTKPIAFAVRDVVAGVDLDAIAPAGAGSGAVAARPRRAGHPRRPAPTVAPWNQPTRR